MPRARARVGGPSGSVKRHSFAPAAGVSPAKRGEAQRSRERSDLDAPAAGYTVASERALARSWLPLWSLLRSFILALRISFCVWIRGVSPFLRRRALTAASPHIRSSSWARHHNPSCSRGGEVSGSGWRYLWSIGVLSQGASRATAGPDPVKPAFSFAGVGWSGLKRSPRGGEAGLV